MLTGLIPGTEYTYKSYDVSTCGDTHEGDSVTFTTGGVSVSNLGDAASSHQLTVGDFNGSNIARAANFTTGNNSAGYTLKSVTARFLAKGGSPTGLVMAVYSKHTSKSEPGTSLVTLAGNNPDAAGDYTYTCSGNNCHLSADTTYYLVLSTPTSPSGAQYKWRATQSRQSNQHTQQCQLANRRQDAEQVTWQFVDG